MSYLRFFLIPIIFIMFFSSCQDTAEAQKEEYTQEEVDQVLDKLKISNTDSILQIGDGYVDSNPRKALRNYHKVSSQLIKDKEYLKAGETFINMAHIYQDKLNLIDSAIVNAEMALFMWESLEDSVQIKETNAYITELKDSK